MTLEQLARGCTFFSQQEVMFGLVVFGFLWGWRKVMVQAAMLVLFATILNLWLKSIFQVPLPEAVGHEGWAFPSGHMTATAVFYGWLAYSIRRPWAWVAFTALLGAEGWAIVKLGYHYPSDIWASVVVSSCLLVLYGWLATRRIFDGGAVAFLGVVMALLSVAMIMGIPKERWELYLFVSLGSLIGVYTAWGICMKVLTGVYWTRSERLLSFIIYGFGMGSAYLLVSPQIETMGTLYVVLLGFLQAIWLILLVPSLASWLGRRVRNRFKLETPPRTDWLHE